MARTKATTGTKDWNVMVYLAGDNNLSSEMVWALTEMERVRPRFKKTATAVSARFDPSGAGPRSYDFSPTPKVTPSRAFHKDPISKSKRTLDKFRFKTDAEELDEAVNAKLNQLKALRAKAAGKAAIAINAKIVELQAAQKKLGGKSGALPEEISKLAEQSADPAAVEFFINSNFDVAKYNLVVLSGHAVGAAGEFLQDTDPVNSLSIPDFRDMLARIVTKNGQKIEVLGLDTCVMSMIEVCYEVRKSVGYLVGAEGFEQNIGWPYQKILGAIKKKMLPSKLSQEIVRQYIAYYRDYEIAGVSTDLAACDLSKFDSLIQAVAKLVGQLKTALSTPSTKDAVKNAILVAHWEAQSYLSDQYVDLYDFCDRLTRIFAKGTPIHQECTSITGILNGGRVVLKSCYTGPGVQHSHGLSIYFPWSAEAIDEDLKKYQKLEFAQETGWAGFLEKYLKETRSPRRDQPDKTVLHIAPPADPLVVVSSFLPLRNPAAGTCRGLSFSVGGTKNPPDGFLRDKCD
jgi:hypothetical protein